MKTVEIIVKGEKVEAHLIKFPIKDIESGVKRYNELRKTTSDTIEKYVDMMLCKYESMWWIYYSKNRMTGSFTSKKEAIGWFVKAGR